MIRQLLLAASRSDGLKATAVGNPITKSVVDKYVAGEDGHSAIATVAGLADQGMLSSVDYLGEDTTSAEQAFAVRDAYLHLLQLIGEHGLAGVSEVSVKLSAVGQSLPDGQQFSTSIAHEICTAAQQVGTAVTLDMEDHTTTDMTLETLAELRQDFPNTGAVLQAYLRRTEADCRDLSGEGSRVRLCKGAYKEPESVAFQHRAEVDRNYVRCLKILMAGSGYPMVATHDPRLIDIAEALAVRTHRPRGTYEYQMLFGVRPEEQLRFVAQGEKVRVYVPYGDEWYGYLIRRLAERPANMALFVRSLVDGR